MDIIARISRNLNDWMSQHPDLNTIKKVSVRSGVGFGTVQRAKNGDGNITVRNLEAIAVVSQFEFFFLYGPRFFGASSFTSAAISSSVQT